MSPLATGPRSQEALGGRHCWPYTEVDILYKLFVHQTALADLNTLRSTQPKAAARILAVLQECQGSQYLLDRLTQHDYGRSGSAPIHVSKWLAHWNKGTD